MVVIHQVKNASQESSGSDPHTHTVGVWALRTLQLDWHLLGWQQWLHAAIPTYSFPPFATVDSPAVTMSLSKKDSALQELLLGTHGTSCVSVGVACRIEVWLE